MGATTYTTPYTRAENPFASSTQRGSFSSTDAHADTVAIGMFYDQDEAESRIQLDQSTGFQSVNAEDYNELNFALMAIGRQMDTLIAEGNDPSNQNQLDRLVETKEALAAAYATADSGFNPFFSVSTTA